jgi:hypothetical protein
MKKTIDRRGLTELAMRTSRHDVCIPMNLKTAEFFRQHGYTSPIDGLDTPAQHAYDAKGKTHMIDLLMQHGPEQGLASMMATWMLDRPHWSDDNLGFYPVKERLIEGAAGGDGAVFLVDVGGSKGQDLTKFLARHPLDSFPGQLILQDRAEVIDSIPEGSLGPGVHAMAHDFNTPQPVRGKCYAIVYHGLQNRLVSFAVTLF